jgi:hypothetical protein
MSRAEYYRSEASRCHMAAVTCRDPEEAARWRDLSQGYQDVAALFESLNRLAHGETTLHRAPAVATPAAAPARFAASTMSATARVVPEPLRKAG